MLGSMIGIGTLPLLGGSAQAGIVRFPAQELANKYVLVRLAITPLALFDPYFVTYLCPFVGSQLAFTHVNTCI
jgi:hypothetical protein